MGVGALAQMLSPESFALKAPKNPLRPRKPHFKNAAGVIYIHLTGSPPHLDMWDYKPELVKRTDQECPDQFIKGKTPSPSLRERRSYGHAPYFYKATGKSGMWMSDAIPNFHKHADDFYVIKSDAYRSVQSRSRRTVCAHRFSNPAVLPSGLGQPTALGSRTRILPGYAVLISSGTQPNGVQNSSSAGPVLPFIKGSMPVQRL